QVQLTQKQAGLGLTNPADTQVAAAALAEAKARLAERKLAAAGAGDALAAWNRQLLDLTIDLHERDARLAMIADKLDHFAGTVEQAQKLEVVQSIATKASLKADAALDEYDDAQSGLGLFTNEPKFTVEKD